MTIKYYRKVAPKIRMQLLESVYAFKLVINIITNFLYTFSRQFMKSSISWNMFCTILVFCF